MASSFGRVELKAKLTHCSSKAKSEKKMSKDEFIALFRFVNTTDKLLELQTTISRALSFIVSHFEDDKALDIISNISESCLLTCLVQDHIVCEFDFPEGDYTTKARDAKKLFDDFYGEARQLIHDVHKKFDINLVQKLGIIQLGSSLLDQLFLSLEKFSKESKDFEAAIELDKAIQEPSYGLDVITLGQLYMEWVRNEEENKFVLPQPEAVMCEALPMITLLITGSAMVYWNF